MTRLLTAALVASALVPSALAAPPALATHRKPLTQSYDVLLPVPYAVDGPSHCADGLDGLSYDKRDVVLPDRGRLDVRLSGFLGDWVVELFDAKGRLIAQSAMFEPTNTAPVRKLTYKKAARGQRVTVAVCNVTGGPRGSVTWTFTFR